MNPHKAKVGCEVGVCQADHCDIHRKQTCYLRQCWLENRDRWLYCLGKAKLEATKTKYRKKLKGIGYDPIASGPK